MDLILYGFGGFGYTVAEIAIENGFKNIGVFDDKKLNSLEITNGTLVYLGSYNEILYPKVPIIIAIGNNEVRAKILATIKHQTISLIHSSAQISKSASIEKGTIILQNVVIGANTTIKECCIINTASVIDHDCIIQNFTHIRPLAFIGSNSEISSFTTIEPNSFIERFSRI